MCWQRSLPLPWNNRSTTNSRPRGRKTPSLFVAAGLQSNDADRPTGDMGLALFEQPQDSPETSSASAFAEHLEGHASRIDARIRLSDLRHQVVLRARILVERASLAVFSQLRTKLSRDPCRARFVRMRRRCAIANEIVRIACIHILIPPLPHMQPQTDTPCAACRPGDTSSPVPRKRFDLTPGGQLGFRQLPLLSPHKLR